MSGDRESLRVRRGPCRSAPRSVERCSRCSQVRRAPGAPCRTAYPRRRAPARAGDSRVRPTAAARCRGRAGAGDDPLTSGLSRSGAGAMPRCGHEGRPVHPAAARRWSAFIPRLARRPGVAGLTERLVRVTRSTASAASSWSMSSRWSRRPAGFLPVGLHHSCHGLRELRLGSGSERRIPRFDKIGRLLGASRGSRWSRWSSRRAPTSAAASAAPSRSPRMPCRARWATIDSPRTSTPGRDRDRRGHVVPDAPRRPDPARSPAAARDARGRDPRRGRRRLSDVGSGLAASADRACHLSGLCEQGNCSLSQRLPPATSAMPRSCTPRCRDPPHGACYGRARDEGFVRGTL